MLETVKDLKYVNGKKVLILEDAKKLHKLSKPDGSFNWDLFDEYRKDFPISISHDQDMISFKMLTKPASEGGNLELCQLTELISVAKHMLEYLNKDYPCRENAMTITKLDEALMWQEKRTKDRLARGVEGKYEN